MILKKRQIRIVYHAYTELLLDFALLFLGQEKNYVDQSLSVKQFKGVPGPKGALGIKAR